MKSTTIILFIVAAAFLASCSSKEGKNMKDEMRKTLLGQSRQQAEEWLKVNAVTYGFESINFLIETGAYPADAPELHKTRGRYNGLLKRASGLGRHGITEVDLRIYLYVSETGNVSDLVINEVVTGP